MDGQAELIWVAGYITEIAYTPEGVASLARHTRPIGRGP